MAGRDVLVAGLDRAARCADPRDRCTSSEAAVRAAFRETIEGLLEGGVDVFWFETFALVDHLAIAVEEARVGRGRPADRGAADLRRGRRAAPTGRRPAAAARRSPVGVDVDVIGVNCGAGPVGCLDALVAMGRRRDRRDPPERRPAAADRGAVRLRRRARLPRPDGRRHARRGRGHRRRLLRDDAGAHRGDARRDRRAGRAGPTAAGARRRVAGAAATTIRAEVAAAADDAPPPPSRLARALADGRYVDLGRDRPAALGPHRAHDRGGAPAPGRRRRHRQRQRLGDGPGADGRAGRRVRHPARPRPRVRRPRHDPRPEPDGARVGAARRPRARRPRHPGPDRRPAADRRPTRRRPASGTSTRSGWSRSWRGSTAARMRPARRSASRPSFTIACALDPTAADAADGVGSPGAQGRRRRAPRS